MDQLRRQTALIRGDPPELKCVKRTLGTFGGNLYKGHILYCHPSVDAFSSERYNKERKIKEVVCQMKLMIASDIHGSALYCGQLLRAYEREGADRLLLLGDILYHGPRNDLPEGYAPKEVISLLNPMKEELLCVRGNCDTEVDQMVLEFPIMAEYCVLELACASSSERDSAEKDRGQVREQDRAEKGSGNRGQRTVTLFATHGHVHNPHHLPPLKQGDILLNGHTHIPACEEIMDMEGRTYWYLNPGSVSIPKEGSAHSYMIWENGSFVWKNLEGEEYMTWKTDSRC